ncbi:MAG: LysR substrate-binding domain-containing protein [Gemmataceae bacterium]
MRWSTRSTRVPSRALAERRGSTWSFSLLHGSDRSDWPLWFRARGIRAAQVRRGLAFSDEHLIVQAAIAGQGLALVRDVFVEGDLRLKRLVKVLDGSWPAQFAYYLVGHRQALQKSGVRRFRDRMLQEGRRMTD